MSQKPDAFPRPLTRLIGRDGTAREVAALLAQADVRLLTLTGVGGAGKTRLAIFEHGGSRYHERFRRQFAEIRRGGLIVHTVPRALGVTERATTWWHGEPSALECLTGRQPTLFANEERDLPENYGESDVKGDGSGPNSADFADSLHRCR